MKNSSSGKERKPYFRFSHKVKDPEELDSWFEWFRGKNIPCCITEIKSGSRYIDKYYALWRAGKEYTYFENRANTEPLEGRIVRIFDPVGVFRKEVSEDTPTMCLISKQKLTKGGELEDEDYC